MENGSSEKIISSFERNYIEVLNNLPIGIFRNTLEGKVVFCNLTFAKIFGFDSVEAIIGRPIIDLYQNKKDRGEMIKTILEKNRIIELPLAFKKKDGTTIWCAISSRAVIDEDGMIIYLEGTVRDISAEFERRVGEKDKLEGVLEMAGGVSHSINQPLTIINNLLSEVMENTSRQDKNYAKLARIEEQLKKLNELIKKIGKIKKYEVIDYVAGVKIVDIEKAS
jgi:PAS domain S-box-containing protein